MGWTGRALESLSRAGVPVPQPVADIWLERTLRTAAAASEQERRRVWDTWTAAVRRTERRSTRARRNLVRWPTVAAGAALLAVPLEGELALGACALAAFGVSQTVSAVHTLVRPPAAPPRPVLPAVLPPPPPRTSTAFPVVRRLEELRHELHHVLGPTWYAGDAVRDAAGSALAAAAAADLALRETAARVGWLESLPAASTAVDHSRLVGELRVGLAAQERLLQAATELAVAAVAGQSSAELPLIRLREAAESLAGLAAGVRTVRDLGGGPAGAATPFATA